MQSLLDFDNDRFLQSMSIFFKKNSPNFFFIFKVVFQDSF
ncbi:hypothetical protein D1BOALGB6SA_2530 [Olavius sp. associated proteobacterium Delta 1]|nr:hypothetical protein D1BOALGB6SA_2530 [Olavius sp. associated proteobacterium Delta 1]